ncbi:MAG: hypothetical protein M0C28_48760 [Candidatus Moduliflexus flocculans]|nr:hypothetical protein [Candidatus Moduliflexus flocculans]
MKSSARRNKGGGHEAHIDPADRRPPCDRGLRTEPAGELLLPEEHGAPDPGPGGLRGRGLRRRRGLRRPGPGVRGPFGRVR